MSKLTTLFLGLVGAFAASLILSTPANADVLSLSAEVRGGAAGGQGVNGAQKDEAFSSGARGPSYGAWVGVEFFMIDIAVGHEQIVTSEGLATWTTLPYIGFDTEFDIGRPSGKKNADGSRARTDWFSEVALGIGAGFGTGQQVEPPLDKSQVSDKGLFMQVQLGFGYRLSDVLSIGFSVPVQGRYMFKTDDFVNDTDNHYQSVAVSGLVSLRTNLKIK